MTYPTSGTTVQRRWTGWWRRERHEADGCAGPGQRYRSRGRNASASWPGSQPVASRADVCRAGADLDRRSATARCRPNRPASGAAVPHPGEDAARCPDRDRDRCSPSLSRCGCQCRWRTSRTRRPRYGPTGDRARERGTQQAACLAAGAARTAWCRGGHSRPGSTSARWARRCPVVRPLGQRVDDASRSLGRAQEAEMNLDRLAQPEIVTVTQAVAVLEQSHGVVGAASLPVLAHPDLRPIVDAQLDEAIVALVLLRCVAMPAARGQAPRRWSAATPVKLARLHDNRFLGNTVITEAVNQLHDQHVLVNGRAAGIRPGPAFDRLTASQRRRIEEDLLILAAPGDPVVAALNRQRSQGGPS